VPGDTIEYHVKKMSQRKTMWWFRGEAKVAGKWSPKPRSAP